MRLTLTFTCDNAAFSEGEGYEIAHILRAVAARIEGTPSLESWSRQQEKVRDTNGNTVGYFTFSED